MENNNLSKMENMARELMARRQGRKHLIDFITYTKPDYEVARHHTYACDYAERILRYLNDPKDPKGINRLIINMPPRHGKSEIFTRRLPAYFLGKNPSKFVISASYNADLATDFGRAVRQIVSSPEYHNLFPAVDLAPDSRAADRWNTTQNGAYFAVGVGGGVTGRGMHLGIIDDPFKGQEEADSQPFKDKLWKWWKSDFKTRMMPDAAIIIAKTRWAKDGLVGRILDAEGPKWTIINLPGLAEDPDPLGRKPGMPLWPEWFNREALLDMEMGMSLREWSALYQGNPIPEGGNLFKTEWFKTWTNLPPMDILILAMDTAWDDTQRADYSVILALGVGPDGYYLLGMWRKKVEYPDLKKQVDVEGLRWKPSALACEDKQSGKAIIQELKRSCRWPVIPVAATKDKITRARAVTPLFEAGRVFFPELAPWREIVEAELAEFPGGKYDDIVDALVHGLTYLHENFTYTGYSGDQGAAHPVERDWDIYQSRDPDPQIITHWDVYGRMH